MTYDTNDSFEFIFTSKEVGEKVGIKTPTVRKYGQLLERYGYEFQKNGERRNFVESDILVMKEMKKSSNIEKTARELSEKQKRQANISDTEMTVLLPDTRVSPPDMTLVQEGLKEFIEKSEKRYDSLVNSFEMMVSDYSETKEKMNSIEENSERILQEMKEMKQKYEEANKEKEIFKEKLDLALDYIQKEEENKKEVAAGEETEKKSIWRRLFG